MSSSADEVALGHFRGRPCWTQDPRCSSHSLPLWQPLCKLRAQLRELRRMVAMTQSIGTSIMLCICLR